MKIGIEFRRALALAAVSVVCSSWCLAQNQTPTPTKFSVTVTDIKPDMVGEWERLIMDELNPALRKAGSTMRTYWQSGNLGNRYRYTSIRPLENFASLDEPSPLRTSLGNEAFNALFTKIGRMHAAPPVSRAVQLRDDMSFPKELGEQHRRLALVSHIKVMAGRTMDFERLIKTDVLPALRKADVNGYRVFETLLTGDPNEYHTVIYVNRYADFDRGHPLRRALGEDGYRKLMAKTAGITQSIERDVIRYRDDLSFQPPAQRASR